MRFRSKAAERGTGFSDLVQFFTRLKPKSHSLSFVDLSLLGNHKETLAKQVRDYNRLETPTFFCRCQKKKKRLDL